MTAPRLRTAEGAPSRHSVDIWNLRGYSIPMNKLGPKIIAQFKRKGYITVIIDPIYKVLTGNENKAYDMTQFCNYFEQVAVELNCAVIYCHHHSKWNYMDFDKGKAVGKVERLSPL